MRKELTAGQKLAYICLAVSMALFLFPLLIFSGARRWYMECLDSAKKEMLNS
jgi:hypothetical protein